MAPSATTITQTYNSNIYTDIHIVSIDDGGYENKYGALVSKEMVQDCLKNKIAQIDVDTCEPGEEDAFYVADLGEVYRQHLRWKKNLARVKPFYGAYIFLGSSGLMLTSYSRQMQPRPRSLASDGKAGHRL